LEETNTAYGRSWFVSAKCRSSVGRAGPAPGRHAPLARRRVLQLPLAAQGRSQRTTRCRQFRQGRSSRERHRAGAALAGQGNSPRPAAPGCVVPGVSEDFYCRIASSSPYSGAYTSKFVDRSHRCSFVFITRCADTANSDASRPHSGAVIGSLLGPPEGQL